MADKCGDCKYYESSKCPNSNYDSTHSACRDFKSR